MFPSSFTLLYSCPHLLLLAKDIARRPLELRGGPRVAAGFSSLGVRTNAGVRLGA